MTHATHTTDLDRRAKASVGAAIEAERRRHASLLAAVRLVGVSLFIALFGVLGTLFARPEWRADWWLLLPYWALGAVAWRSRRKPWFTRYAGWSIVLADVPFVFVLQWLSLPSSTSPGGVAGFTLGIFALLIFLVSLTYHRYDLIAAVALCNLCEVALQREAGLGAGACIAASIMLWIIGITAQHAGSRVRDLAMFVYDSANTNAQVFRQLSDIQSSFRALIDGMNDVVIAYHNEEIVYANRALLRLCGHEDIDDVLGCPLSKLLETLPPDVGAHSFETTLKTNNRDPVPIEAQRMPMNFMGMPSQVIIGRDITERKMAMRQMALNERMVTMGMLAAGVAHEINNPLAAVLGHLDLISESARVQRERTQEMIFGDAKHHVTKMRQDITELANAHLDSKARHDLLNLMTPLCSAFDLAIEYELGFRDQYLADVTESISRASKAAAHVSTVAQNLKNLAAPQDQQQTPIALQPILDTVLGMALHVVRGQAHVTCGSAGDAWIFGNGSGLIQVLLNLLINAGQAVATTARKDIHVSVEGDSDAVVISVQDTGTGMPLEVQKKLFSAFFTTKPAGIGTGMGLSLSKKIIEAMGGRLWFESYSDVGTTFLIELRAAPKQVSAHPSEDVRVEPPPSRSVATDAHRARVLVVDDNAMVGDIVRRALAQDNEVTVCTSPIDALERIKKGDTFDAIVCDVMMPDMTGLQLHGQIGALDRELAEKMVFVSGSVYEGDVYQALGNLPNQLLAKPFELAEIRDAVRRSVNLRQYASSAR